MPDDTKEHDIRLPPIALLFVLLIVIVSGCSATLSAAQSVAAPAMPAHWTVISDLTFSAADIEPVAERLGGAIAALRNTMYDVEGKRVQLNTILATDKENADKILDSLRKMKSEVGLFRQGLTIYEFVGPNNVLPEIRAGKAHLEAELTNAP